MKALKATLLFLAVLLGMTASAAALAQHRHHGHGHGHGARFGFFIGAPAFWYGSPYYYNRYPYAYGAYPYYPQTVVVPSGPTTYVEQDPVETAPPPSAPAPAASSWYYCRESNAYYPYVNQCAGPWERVSPRPPS
jgi:hypothetical protein